MKANGGKAEYFWNVENWELGAELCVKLKKKKKL